MAKHVVIAVQTPYKRTPEGLERAATKNCLVVELLSKRDDKGILSSSLLCFFFRSHPTGLLCFILRLVSLMEEFIHYFPYDPWDW